MTFHTGAPNSDGVAPEWMRISADGQVKINSLKCNNCLVMTDETGKLYAQENKIEELQTRITQLENKLASLLSNEN